MSKIGRVMASFIFMFLTTTVAAWAATDVVTTITGEKIVGEIKKVEKDVLTIETAYSRSSGIRSRPSRATASSWWRRLAATVCPAR